jgi:predicted RNA-binding protein with TRAM domain
MKFKEYSSGPKQSSVQEGQTMKVKIVDVGKQGDGIARVDGLIIFVKGAKVGEEIDVKVSRVSKNAAFAERTEQPSG